MFRNRRNNQKPPQEFYTAFKQRFPHRAPNVADGASDPRQLDAVTKSDIKMNEGRLDRDHATAGQDEGTDQHPHALSDGDAWRLTPFGLDSASFNFPELGEQDPDDNGSTPATALTALFHPQAGDLHTPGVPFPWGTPLSMGETHPMSSMDLTGFSRNVITPHNIHLQPQLSHPPLSQPQTFAPTAFIHRDSGYDSVEQPFRDDSEGKFESMPPDSGPSPLRGGHAARPALPTERFRFHVTLNAPTAMVNQPDEIPITYLNKGQAYAITLTDTAGPGFSPALMRYRTVIRISFDDEEQRQKPAACWQLWKEGRGVAEAHQRDGRLQAVEFVEAPAPVDGDSSKRPRIDVEMASFDSFAVTWSPASNAATAACNLAVRFNFLSTDFSHSKGVKGIPVRLCAKTEIMSSATPETPLRSALEVCYCKAKLFRDHGAERKLSNDVAHIRKLIDKVKAQIVQAENGAGGSRKRKRADSSAGQAQRPAKGLSKRHNREGSVSSSGTSDAAPTIEDSLHQRLACLQDMFSSTRPISVLHLRGEEHDDPDAFPVTLSGVAADLTSIDPVPPPPPPRQASWDTSASGKSGSPTSRASSAQHQLSSPHRASTSHPTSLSLDTRSTGAFSRPATGTSAMSDSSAPLAQPNATQKIKRRGLGQANAGEWIEAMDIDASYTPPPPALHSQDAAKPIACFYVLYRTAVTHSSATKDVYNAIYLSQRSSLNLIQGVCAKYNSASASSLTLHPSQIVRALRINARGLKIAIDDEMVREMPEAQDMLAEFVDLDDADEQRGGLHDAGSDKGDAQVTAGSSVSELQDVVAVKKEQSCSTSPKRRKSNDVAPSTAAVSEGRRYEMHLFF